MNTASGSLENRASVSANPGLTSQGADGNGVVESEQLPAETTFQPRKAKPGFLSLPLLVRRKIYRFLMVTGRNIKVQSPFRVRSSSALLRTCRQIHKEAANVLYGQNTFVIERERRTVGEWWDSVWTEVGYSQGRDFLDSIGPKNVSLLRTVGFICVDGLSVDLMDLATSKQRRFVKDEALMECFRILANYGELRRIFLAFWGHRSITIDDAAFIDELKEVKADEVIHSTPRSELDIHAAAELSWHMEREPTLYPRMARWVPTSISWINLFKGNS